ncbi:queuosine precursor transporter [Fulvivirgaceae bacterium BMA10]|uniref:Probable queuosine precursor transporter n=1 Tax=Splendidivirga corallicola TaxID=3051826 RepID=A0ABT8KUY1_9BACT|nr:queuosine precursor transporter [Fulvivirgaceae bacterium BMA10]
MAVISNIMFTNMVSSKIVTIFGLDATVANVFYAAIFLATDLLSEHYGKKVALRAVWLGFFALVPIVFFAPLVNMFQGTLYSQDVHYALGVIFGKAVRISVASLAAYLLANFFDVWWFHKIKNRYPDKKYLWLRNNGSTILSQFIDNSTFTLLAFAAAVPFDALWQIFISGYIIKIIVAVCDTPFVYLSHFFKPEDIEE